MDGTGCVPFIGVDLHKCTVTLQTVRADDEPVAARFGRFWSHAFAFCSTAVGVAGSEVGLSAIRPVW